MNALFPTIYTNLIYFTTFAVITSVCYRLLNEKVRSLFLLFINLLFYYLCTGLYVVMLLITGIWSFYGAKQIENRKNKKIWLIFTLVPIVLTLLSLKYSQPLTFLLSLVKPYSAVQLLLPLGLSYYSLKSISYIYDVYKGKYATSKSIISYLSYITFFGQIIAGPIQRFNQWVGTNDSFKNDCVAAYYLLVRGLFMKLLIAKRIGPYALDAMMNCESANGLNLLLGFFLYTVYIYCDFAGYSYLSIAIARLFGISCPDNFKLPYFSLNIKEFWNSWHISLSSWLKDYIYIPLGGNRLGTARRTINLLITFFVSGMWHGASLNYIIWGLYHGVINLLSPKKYNVIVPSYKSIFSIITTWLIVSFGWILFATPSLIHAKNFIKGMLFNTTFSINAIQDAILPFTGDNTCLSNFLIAIFFIGILFFKELNEKFNIFRSTTTRSFIWQTFILTSLLLFGQFGNASFIYAGF